MPDAPAEAADVASALESLGASRVESALLAHLVTQGAADTATIMDASGLRQPEVSVGMRNLRDRGWVVTRPVPRGGKGRPMNRYHLRVPRAALCEHYQRIAEEKIQETEDAISGLATMLGCHLPSLRRSPPSSATTTAVHRPRNRPQSRTPG